MSINTINNKLAVIPPVYSKIETEVKGGFATISQKTNLIACDLVFSFKLPDGTVVRPGKHKILVAGDAGLQGWTNNVYNFDDKEFALLPVNFMIGYTEINLGSSD